MRNCVGKLISTCELRHCCNEELLFKIGRLSASFQRFKLVHLSAEELKLNETTNNLPSHARDTQSDLPKVKNMKYPSAILQVTMAVDDFERVHCFSVHYFTSRRERCCMGSVCCLPPMANERVEMSVYSIVISRHLLLGEKCMCHILTPVILFSVTTSISMVFVAPPSLSLSHHVAELNLIVVIKKTREGETILFIHSFLSLSPLALPLACFLLRSTRRTGEKDEHKTANARHRSREEND